MGHQCRSSSSQEANHNQRSLGRALLAVFCATSIRTLAAAVRRTSRFMPFRGCPSSQVEMGHWEGTISRARPWVAGLSLTMPMVPPMNGADGAIIPIVPRPLPFFLPSPHPLPVGHSMNLQNPSHHPIPASSSPKHTITTAVKEDLVHSQSALPFS